MSMMSTTSCYLLTSKCPKSVSVQPNHWTFAKMTNLPEQMNRVTSPATQILLLLPKSLMQNCTMRPYWPVHVLSHRRIDPSAHFLTLLFTYLLQHTALQFCLSPFDTSDFADFYFSHYCPDHFADLISYWPHSLPLPAPVLTTLSWPVDLLPDMLSLLTRQSRVLPH